MSVTIRGTDNSAANPAVTGTDGDTGVFFPAANQVALATGGTAGLLLNSSQEVGIGNGVNLTNRLALSYNTSSGLATVGPNSTGGSTTLALGTTNSGAYSNAIVVDFAGRVTQPLQPVFRAYHSGDIQWNSGNLSPVIYNTSMVNTGSNYNTSTGVFTAPVAGKYLFSVYEMFMGEASYTFTYAAVQLNGSSETEFMREGDRPDYATFGGTVILNVAANDQVRVVVGIAGVDSGYLRGGLAMNSFMGYLIA